MLIALACQHTIELRRCSDIMSRVGGIVGLRSVWLGIYLPVPTVHEHSGAIGHTVELCSEIMAQVGGIVTILAVDRSDAPCDTLLNCAGAQI